MCQALNQFSFILTLVAGRLLSPVFLMAVKGTWLPVPISAFVVFCLGCLSSDSASYLHDAPYLALVFSVVVWHCRLSSIVALALLLYDRIRETLCSLQFFI